MEKLQSTITDDFELEKNLIRKSPEKLLVILRGINKYDCSC